MFSSCETNHVCGGVVGSAFSLEPRGWQKNSTDTALVSLLMSDHVPCPHRLHCLHLPSRCIGQNTVAFNVAIQTFFFYIFAHTATLYLRGGTLSVLRLITAFSTHAPKAKTSVNQCHQQFGTQTLLAYQDRSNLFQASLWPTLLYGEGHIATCCLASVLCFHMGRDTSILWTGFSFYRSAVLRSEWPAPDPTKFYYIGFIFGIICEKGAAGLHLHTAQNLQQNLGTVWTTGGSKSKTEKRWFTDRPVFQWRDSWPWTACNISSLHHRSRNRTSGSSDCDWTQRHNSGGRKRDYTGVYC